MSAISTGLLRWVSRAESIVTGSRWHLSWTGAESLCGLVLSGVGRAEMRLEAGPPDQRWACQTCRNDIRRILGL